MRKKILILGHNDSTQFIDVINQYVALFDPNEYEVTVGYLTGAKNEKTQNRTLGTNVIFFEFSKKSVRGLKIKPFFKLFTFCKKQQFEIVICHRYKPTYLMMIIAQFIRFRVLFFVMHELFTVKKIGRKILIASLLKKNMIFGGVSNAVRDDLRKDLRFINKQQIVTLYNVIDLNLTEPYLINRESARKSLKIQKNEFMFVNVARLAKNKDQRTLILAFKKIKHLFENVKLMIIGEGLLKNELKQLVKHLTLDQDVIFTGFLENASRYMPAFDCFVLSSRQEAFGRVLLEAMIAKLPIIATKVHGIPEVLGPHNTLVEQQNINQLAKAMLKIYLTPKEERENLSMKAYEYLIENYSIPSFKKQFWELPLIS